jgi:hypothetical protein
MRVVIRHSKLLYFRKHLPPRQFLGLSWIVSGEALVRGAVARVLGEAEERRAWQAIRSIASRMRSGALVKGAEVLMLAEGVERGDGSPVVARQGPHSDPDRRAAGRPGGPVGAETCPVGRDRPL